MEFMGLYWYLLPYPYERQKHWHIYVYECEDDYEKDACRT